MKSFMRAVVVAALAATGIATQNPAHAEAGSWTPSWTFSVDMLSKYVGGPNNILLYDKPVNQNNIRAQWKSGFYVNVWNSQILGTESPVGNAGNEIDYAVGYAGKLGSFGFDISLSYFDLSAPKLFEFRGDIVQIGLELNREFTFDEHTFTPYLRVEPSWVTAHAAPFGAYFHAGVGHRWKVNDFLSIADSARVVYDAGVYGMTEGYNARFDFSPVWKLTPELDLRLPYARYFVPLSHYGDGRKNELVLGVGLDWHPK